ncbi:MAG: hypothetical protein U1G07_27410 [Verrucomicrobiota bacterium]
MPFRPAGEIEASWAAVRSADRPGVRQVDVEQLFMSRIEEALVQAGG